MAVIWITDRDCGQASVAGCRRLRVFEPGYPFTAGRSQTQ